MEIQVRILPALCALHNFIRIYDNDEIHEFNDIEQTAMQDPLEQLAVGPVTMRERNRAYGLHDKIAQDMWDSYQSYRREMGEI